MASDDEAMSLDGYESNEGMWTTRDFFVDERLAMEDEIATLKEENAALQEKKEALAYDNEDLADRLAVKEDQEAAVEERETVVEAKERALVRKLAQFSFDTDQLVAENCALVRDNKALREKIKKARGSHDQEGLCIKLLAWGSGEVLRELGDMELAYDFIGDFGTLVSGLTGISRSLGATQVQVSMKVMSKDGEGAWVEMDDKLLALWTEFRDSKHELVALAYPQRLPEEERKAMHRSLVLKLRSL